MAYRKSKMPMGPSGLKSTQGGGLEEIDFLKGIKWFCGTFVFVLFGYYHLWTRLISINKYLQLSNLFRSQI